MSDLRSEPEVVEGELMDAPQTEPAQPDTQAIDVVEIVESDPGATVLEQHVAEQEWTREFVIDDEAPGTPAFPDERDGSAPAGEADGPDGPAQARSPSPPRPPSPRPPCSRCRW